MFFSLAGVFESKKQQKNITAVSGAYYIKFYPLSLPQRLPVDVFIYSFVRPSSFGTKSNVRSERALRKGYVALDVCESAESVALEFFIIASFSRSTCTMVLHVGMLYCTYD